MNREKLLQQIAELQFVGVELNLFLDMHPDNQDAWNDYNAYSAQLNALRDEYNRQCGPLLGFANQSLCASDAWVNTPWPWKAYKN